MRVATLNVQNLRLLYEESTPYLHGAWDSDCPETEALAPIDRRLTARLLYEINADVVALQEVFDLASLDFFHDKYLLPSGLQSYRHRICLPGNDGRGLDVALLSRRHVGCIQSHATLTPLQLDIAPPGGVDPNVPVFRRDCLMVTVGKLTLFVCHYKSAYPDPETAWVTRRIEALATRRIIERKFETPDQELWLVLGDLNEPDTGDADGQRAIAPLEGGFSVDLMCRLPRSERWTYYDSHSGEFHCPDALLASPALARRFPQAQPVVLRKGLGSDIASNRELRFAGVGMHRPHASDHAAVYVDFPDL